MILKLFLHLSINTVIFVLTTIQIKHNSREGHTLRTIPTVQVCPFLRSRRKL